MKRRRVPQEISRGAVVVPEEFTLPEILTEMWETALMGYPVYLTPAQTRLVLALCHKAGETTFERQE